MSRANPVADAATAALRDLLLRGRYQPGDRLPAERQLAAGLGLSRPTLRESIGRLTEAGVLESHRGSGTYVASVPLDAVFAVRLQLEPYASRLAAVERTDAQSRRLGVLVKALADQIDEPDAFSLTDLEIHRTIATASGNPVLQDLLERLTELTQISRSITSARLDTRRGALGDLRRVIRAVRRRDADAAAAAMEVHLRSVQDAGANLAPRDRRILPATRHAGELDTIEG